jgi:hypothetical protein
MSSAGKFIIVEQVILDAVTRHATPNLPVQCQSFPDYSEWLGRELTRSDGIAPVAMSGRHDHLHNTGQRLGIKEVQ